MFFCSEALASFGLFLAVEIHKVLFCSKGLPVQAWRSLILVSSMSALSSKYIDASKYIALAELLHVGSLIIDDIQDESTVRRGGNCVHQDFGAATAINAGTACYFMAPILGGIDELTQEKQLKIYSLYFDILRCGHAGQGLDILGLDHMMPQVVETGETQELLDSLRAIHVYKTGGPAGTICRMASVLAGADEERAKALENYGTQIGLAFQIVDWERRKTLREISMEHIMEHSQLIAAKTVCSIFCVTYCVDRSSLFTCVTMLVVWNLVHALDKLRDDLAACTCRPPRAFTFAPTHSHSK